MARMHILTQVSPNLFDVIVHAPVPAGNNAAGVLWSTAIVNAGLAATRMAVGNGPGQISNSEATQVGNGTVIEAAFQWGDNPAWTNAERLADLNLRAQQAVDEVTARYAQTLAQFGRTVA